MRRVCAALGMVLALLVLAWAPASAGPVRDDPAPKPVLTISDPAIDESSSLVLSTEHPDLVYTMNDSGDDAVIYVLDRATGRTVGHATLADAQADDIEAMSLGQDGSLMVGDIGDNAGTRSSVEVYLTTQPGRGDSTIDQTKIDLTWPDGARDAEAMLWDSRRQRVYVVAKVDAAPRVYATDPHLLDDGVSSAELKPLADGPVTATDATWLQGTRYAVVRTYTNATVYRVPSFDPVAGVSLPLQKQGESVAAPSARTIWVGSEGIGQRVQSLQLPRYTGGGQQKGEGADGDTASQADTSTSSKLIDFVPIFSLGLVLLGLVLIVLAVVDWWRKR